MKKRFLCLLLSAIMILFCFAGCAEKNDTEVKEAIGEEASKGAVSLSMYLMSEAPVSKDQEKLMEDAVNKITETKYKIHLDLTYVVADEYYDTLDTRLADMKKFYEALQAGEVKKKTEKPEYVGENGLPQVYYPMLQENDVDIFYFGGVDKYNEYMDAGYLAELTGEFDGSSKALKSVINSEILSAFKYINGNKFYAVPTNHAIGEYKYLLINKDVLERTQYAKENITSLTCADCQDMLSQVNKYMADEFVPLYSSGDKLDFHGVEFFNFDENGVRTDKFSVLGGTYKTDRKWGAVNAYTKMSNIMASVNSGNGSIADQISVLKKYDFEGYYAEEGETRPFAVGCITGNAKDVVQYAKDYEIITIENPVIKAEDIYANMFGVTSSSNSVAASMKIITLLNTDATFRNLLLYGIENENYVWVDSDVLDENGVPYRVIERLEKNPKKTYLMSPDKTGNVALTYTEKSEDPVEKIMMLEHNKNLKTEYLLGFSFRNEFASEDGKMDPEVKEMLKGLSEFSENIYDKLKAAKTQEDLDAVIAEINGKFADPAMLKLTSAADGSGSAVDLYTKWLSSKGLHNIFATT